MYTQYALASAVNHPLNHLCSVTEANALFVNTAHQRHLYSMAENSDIVPTVHNTALLDPPTGARATIMNRDNEHANAAASGTVASPDSHPNLVSALPGPSVSQPGASPHSPAASTATPNPRILAERLSSPVLQAEAAAQTARSHAGQAPSFEHNALHVPQATGTCLFVDRSQRPVDHSVPNKSEPLTFYLCARCADKSKVTAVLITTSCRHSIMSCN